MHTFAAIGLACSALLCLGCLRSPAATRAHTPAGTASQLAQPAIPAFQWRTLASDNADGNSWTQPRYRMSLVAGHFIKGSPDEQALQFGPTGSRLIKVDLTTTAVNLKLTDPLPDCFVWDYDGDSVDDVCLPPISSKAMPGLAAKAGAPDGLGVYSLGSKLLGVIPCHLASQFAVGNFSGDGTRELVVIEGLLEPFDASVYGSGGKQIATFHLLGRELGVVVADVDGDGTDELVRSAEVSSGLNRQLFAYGLKTPRTFVVEWPQPPLDFPSTAANLSGVKAQDLLGGHYLWNAAKQVLLPLANMPANAMAAPTRLPTIQLPGTSTALLALDAISDDTDTRTTLQFYNGDGRYVHTEVLGPELNSMITLHSGGVAHLVVQLGDKIMIYP